MFTERIRFMLGRYVRVAEIACTDLPSRLIEPQVQLFQVTKELNRRGNYGVIINQFGVRVNCF